MSETDPAAGPPEPHGPENPPGDDAADVDEIWRRHGDRLRRRARTRLRQYGLTGQAESMDICNDVMTDLMRRGTGPTTPDDALGYVLRAIDHQVLDAFRTLARQCRDFRRNETGPVEDQRLAAASTTPSRIAVRREVIDRVRREVGGGESKAIDLMIAGHDWAEIGEAVGLPPDTIRMRVRRAIARVRQTVAPQPDRD